MDLRYSRELALQRLAKFCRAGFVSVTDFRLSPLKIFAAHEVAALVDPSMATKMTVQFNLFGELRCIEPWQQQQQQKLDCIAGWPQHGDKDDGAVQPVL